MRETLLEVHGREGMRDAGHRNAFRRAWAGAQVPAGGGIGNEVLADERAAQLRKRSASQDPGLQRRFKQVGGKGDPRGV